MNEKSSLPERKSYPQNIERTQSRPTYIPLTDIYDKKDGLVVVSDMPGVDENSLNIQLEKGVLTITGHVPEQERKGYQLLYSEYDSGDYQRSFSISDEINSEKIDAAIKNGILTLNLPRAEKAKARKIPVKVEK